VIGGLSREHVIVSEFVHGRGFEEMKLLPQAERDRIGEIVFRFYFGCMYRHRQFSGDPHPGNCILLDDGRMAFLDFGLFKTIDAEAAEFELQAQRLGIERRADELIQHMYSGGWIGDPKYYSEEKALAMVDDITWWYTQDREIALDPEILFFDEPSAGLDPISARRLDDLILQLRADLGATIVVVTHELDSIFAIGNNSVFLDIESKTQIARGDPRRLRDECDDPGVRSFLTRGREPAEPAR